MARRNIHQSKRLKSRKTVATPAQTVQPPSPARPVAATAVAATPLSRAPVKTGVDKEAAAVKYADLPYELRRIGLFFAFVVVLLIVLWFFLK